MRFAFLCLLSACNFNDPDPCASGSSLVPPTAPTTTTTSSDVVTYAMDAIWLGDTDRTSTTQSTLAWGHFGFDLDNLRSSETSTDVCTRWSGAPSSVQRDGLVCGSKGIDNSFGANIVPFLESVSDMLLSSAITTIIRSGGFTLQFQVHGLGSTSATGLSTDVFGSLGFDPTDGSVPRFSSDESWPVRSDRLATRSPIASSEMLDGFLQSGTFVARGKKLTLDLLLPKGSLTLPIRNVIVTMDIRGDAAENGTIAGEVATEDMVATIQRYSASINKSLCGSAFDGLATTLRQASDILSDGTNRAGVLCDAISIGIGFTAKRIANPARVTDVPNASDPCATDAGMD